MAHKKGAGSSDNGRDSKSKRLGVKLFGGQRAVAGNIIIRQRGTEFHAGDNVYMGRDHTLHAKIDGVVVFKRSFKDRRFVSIEPHAEVLETPVKSAKKATKPVAKAAVEAKPAKKAAVAAEEAVVAVTEAMVAEDAVPEVMVAEDAVPEAMVAEDAVPEAMVAEDAVPEAMVAEDTVLETVAEAPAAKKAAAPKKEAAPEKEAAPKKEKAPKLDDLKIIEGVGPKIETLLKEGGISTWAELAAASEDRLKEILDAAGPRYQIHDPSTWPAQAKFASNGQWDELKEYQEMLTGGRDKSE